MLYKKNSAPSLSPELFRNPTSEYRGTPFWAWNTDLNLDELKRQIDIFNKMGLGGFHMHVRTGMSTTYLSDEFMALIKGCVEKAKEENMLAWLYDEDRWPSGAAGGIVTKNHKYRGRYLLLTTSPCSDDENETDNVDASAVGGRNGDSLLIAVYDIQLNSDGTLASYKLIGENEEASGTKWYAYRKIQADSEWYNNQAYVDTLSKEAIEKFISVTHERYKEVVGDDFNGAIPAIFTDEPQFTAKSNLKSSFDTKDCSIPWTDDLPETYKKAYGIDIIEALPEIFWELPDGRISAARYYYHDHVCERFTEAFADTVGKWCSENNISLTGHMMNEPTLYSQSRSLGEAMRSYRSFGIPGIDMLCASFEFTTAKQTQSAVHQYGKEGMLSELYGVTGWDYDFRGYKLHGDWQACLGVTVRVPHLSWVAMGGEAKRDYPASISYQSPWWTEFSYLEDHFGRVNTLMTRGKPVVKVGVIHPIESYWIHKGPDDLTGEICKGLDTKFQKLCEWMLKGSVDFDYISESLLPDLCDKASAPLKVGEMKYDTVIVPVCDSLRATTLERLKAFREAGGKLVFIGDAPRISDGKYSDEPKKLYDASIKIPYDREAILNVLEEDRYIKLTDKEGKLTDGFIYQLRRDTDGMNLFISRACEPESKHKVVRNDVVITVKGEYSPVLYDTISGDIYEIPCAYKDGNTVIEKTLYDYDSLLLKLYEGRKETAVKAEEAFCGKKIKLPEELDYELTEDNVMLIDMCEFALDGGEFSPEEEILRLDNICRNRLGWRNRGGHVCQPWAIPAEITEHTVTLRYTFESEIDYEGAKLAIEKPETAQIVFNGKAVESKVIGWYTDKDIKTVALPEIVKGKNELVVTIPFGHKTNTEWMYILGKFGVKYSGHTSVITNIPEKITFGSLTDRLFPFYGGNFIYKFNAETSDKLRITASHYVGGLVGVEIDGEKKGRIVFPPYSLTVGDLTPGNHEIRITLFGNRQNSFGPVHRTILNGWIGPDAWRTKENDWSYDYCLRELGLIDKPVLES